MLLNVRLKVFYELTFSIIASEIIITINNIKMYMIENSKFCNVVRWQKSDGAVIRQKNVDMTIEDIRDSWDKICDFDEHSFPHHLEIVMHASIKRYRKLTSNQLHETD